MTRARKDPPPPAAATDGDTILVPARPEAIRIARARSVLVVLDVQNAFLSKNGYIDLCGFDVSAAPAVIAAIGRVISAWRAAGLPIVYFQNGFSAELREATLTRSPLYYKSNALKYMRAHPEAHGRLVTEGSWDFDFVPELRPQAGDTVLRKARYSGFAGTNFEQYLDARGITTLVVVGVNTNVCVESTIRDAYHREYFAIMVPEATMPSGNRAIQEASVFNVETFLGWTTTVAALCSALARPAPGGAADSNAATAR
jgi:ureidoacrylate peracid hydrolase